MIYYIFNYVICNKNFFLKIIKLIYQIKKTFHDSDYNKKK